MNNYIKIPGMEYGFASKLPNSFYEELYPLLERGYGSRVEVFCYGSKSKHYYVDDMPREHFGYPVEGSDIDLAVPNNPLFENILMFDGWVKKGDLGYEEGDGVTVSVWNKKIAEQDVQISFREKDIFPQMKHLWNYMTPEFYWKYINKRSPHYMGRKEVSDYLREQLVLLSAAPTDEVRAWDEGFVYKPAEAADMRMVYWVNPLAYTSNRYASYVDTKPHIREVFSKQVAYANVGVEPVVRWAEEVFPAEDGPQQAQRARPQLMVGAPVARGVPALQIDIDAEHF